MEIPDIHKTIVKLTSLYSDLNELWQTDKCIVNTFQVSRQEKYKGFYEILNQSNIEELTLNVISNSLNKNILIRLQSLIEQNINIYRQRQQQFDGLNFYALYELDEH
jgi:23S rRNA G2069 N7-methylase RlmK/C1962 C5-methylase RlmI